MSKQIAITDKSPKNERKEKIKINTDWECTFLFQLGHSSEHRSRRRHCRRRRLLLRRVGAEVVDGGVLGVVGPERSVAAYSSIRSNECSVGYRPRELLQSVLSEKANLAHFLSQVSKPNNFEYVYYMVKKQKLSLKKGVTYLLLTQFEVHTYY